jgi:hypothetical protein
MKINPNQSSEFIFRELFPLSHVSLLKWNLNSNSDPRQIQN